MRLASAPERPRKDMREHKSVETVMVGVVTCWPEHSSWRYQDEYPVRTHIQCK